MYKKKIVEEHTEDVDGKTMYVKSEGEESRGFRIYFGVIGKWFYPNEEDQKVLEEMFLEAIKSGHIMLGAERDCVELKVSTDIIEDSWKEVERREATKEEIEKLISWGAVKK